MEKTVALRAAVFPLFPKTSWCGQNAPSPTRVKARARAMVWRGKCNYGWVKHLIEKRIIVLDEPRWFNDSSSALSRPV